MVFWVCSSVSYRVLDKSVMLSGGRPNQNNTQARIVVFILEMEEMILPPDAKVSVKVR